MPLRRTVIRGVDLERELAVLRAELELPSGFPAEVEAAAAATAAQPHVTGHEDATDVPLVTLDPAGSRDLDQAFAISRRTGGGFDVAYAIADVGAFVRPGGAVDLEAHRRGETIYLPDGRVPLHPAVLSEGAASLLPGEVRPAVLWRFALDGDGSVTSTHVRRALVRSRAQHDYATFDRVGGELADLLEEVGRLREGQELARGGVSLPVPEQVVECDAGRWVLALRAPRPVEGWNAQLSLMTGMAAAQLMLQAGVGLLRVLPPPDESTVATLRRSALALGVAWPEGSSYAEVIRSLDANVPAHAAVLRLASVLFRGAGYVAFDGAAPEHVQQSAVAAPYAHATAPLRRLADRYVSECCLAAVEGSTPPDWVRAGLAALPDAMADADRRAHAADRAVVDLAEALVLQDRVGERFRGVVVEAGRDDRGEVQVKDPPIRGRLAGSDLPLGAEIDVVLDCADVGTREVRFRSA